LLLPLATELYIKGFGHVVREPLEKSRKFLKTL
jgi:hypothetical protein